MTGSRILVTGGAGFIGTHLVRDLVADGHSVSVLDRMSEQVHGPSPRAPDGCRFLQGDIRDAATVERAMSGIEIVYHLAAETGVGQSQYQLGEYVSTNTAGTANVLEAALGARVSQVVIASSRAVYGEGRAQCSVCDAAFSLGPRDTRILDQGQWDPPCPRCGATTHPLPMSEGDVPAPTSVYGLTKLHQEQLANVVFRTHGLPVTILRLFNVFGPGQSLHNPYCGVLGTFFRRARAGEAVDLYEDGEMLRDFVFVADVVAALRLVTSDERGRGLTINVGSGTPTSLKDLATTVFETLSRTPQLTWSGRYRVGDIRHAVADVAFAEAAIGFDARTRFQNGVQEYAQWALDSEHPDADIDDAAEKQLSGLKLLRRAR